MKYLYKPLFIVERLLYNQTIGIGFSYRRSGAKFHYIANNSAIFLPISSINNNAYTLADLECASGTTSNSSEQLLFLTPNEYQYEFNGILVRQPGHWKLELQSGNYFDIPSFGGGVFTCRMPDENGAILDTSVGIYPQNYDQNSEWSSECCL